MLLAAHDTPLLAACASLLMLAVEEASGDFERPLLLARLPLRPPLLLLSVAHETPLSAACASSSMLPAFTAVEEASGGLERLLLLLRLPLLLLSAARATPLSATCAIGCTTPALALDETRRLELARPCRRRECGESCARGTRGVKGAFVWPAHEG